MMTMLSDYIALTKPRLMPLLNLAAIGSAAMAHGSLPLKSAFVLLIAGSLASGGASAINCYLEKDLDARMSRTKNRPLPMQRIKPMNAVWFGGALILLASILSSLFLNLHATFFILLGAFFYVIVYTLWLKRRHPINIVIGGFAGSCAALAGWSAIRAPDLSAWLMALIVFLWTPSHFWPLAIKLKGDYAQASIPMLPSLMDHRRASFYILGNTILLVISSLIPFYLGILGSFYLYAALSLGTLFILLNIQLIKDEGKAMRNFKYSMLYLSLLMVSAALDSWLANFSL